jgi:hypothetical protein
MIGRADDPRILWIEYLPVETPPLIDSNRIHADYEGLLGPFGEALDELIGAVDRARCYGCVTPLGYHLTNRGGEPEHVIYTATWLARLGPRGPIIRLCEACSPYIPVGGP